MSTKRKKKNSRNREHWGLPAASAFLQTLRVLASIDLLAIALTGGYRVPGTEFSSLYPWTALFLVLLTTFLIEGLKGLSAGKPNPWLGSDGRIFMLIWMVFLSNFRWRGSGDTIAASLEPFALLQHGSLYLDSFFHGPVEGDVSQVYWFKGHLLSKYPSAAGILLVPFNLVSALAGVQPTDLFLHETQKIGASFMVALSAVLVLKTLRFFLSPSWALFLTWAYAFGTSSLSVSSQAIWQHGPGQLFIALGLWFMVRALRNRGPAPSFPWKDHYFWGAFALAVSVCCRYTNLWFYLAVLGYMVFFQRDRLISFLAGSLAPFLGLAADNFFHSGNFLSTGYGNEAVLFDTPFGKGLAGILLSPARGLLMYSPFLLFGLYGLMVAWFRKEWLFLRTLSIGFLGVLLMTAKWHDWGGGWCFGPRLLADTLPVLILALVPVVERIESSKRLLHLFRVLVFFSMGVHILGAYFSWWWERPGSNWEIARHPVVFALSGVGFPVGTLRWMGFLITALLLLGIILCARPGLKPIRPAVKGF